MNETEKKFWNYNYLLNKDNSPENESPSFVFQSKISTKTNRILQNKWKVENNPIDKYLAMNLYEEFIKDFPETILENQQITNQRIFNSIQLNTEEEFTYKWKKYSRIELTEKLNKEKWVYIYIDPSFKWIYELLKFSDKNKLWIKIKLEEISMIIETISYNNLNLENLEYLIKIWKKFNIINKQDISLFITKFLWTSDNLVNKFTKLVNILQKYNCKIDLSVTWEVLLIKNNFKFLKKLVNLNLIYFSKRSIILEYSDLWYSKSNLIFLLYTLKIFNVEINLSFLIDIIKNKLITLKQISWQYQINFKDIEFYDIDLSIFTIEDLLFLWIKIKELQNKIVNFVLKDKNLGYIWITKLENYFNPIYVDGFKESELAKQYNNNLSEFDKYLTKNEENTNYCYSAEKNKIRFDLYKIYKSEIEQYNTSKVINFEKNKYKFEMIHNALFWLWLKENLKELFNEKLNNENLFYFYIIEAKRLNIDLEINKDIIQSFLIKKNIDIHSIVNGLFSIWFLKNWDDWTINIINSILETALKNIDIVKVYELVNVLGEHKYDFKSISVFNNEENKHIFINEFQNQFSNPDYKIFSICIELIKIFNININLDSIEFLNSLWIKSINLIDMENIIKILNKKQLLNSEFLKYCILYYESWCLLEDLIEESVLLSFKKSDKYYQNLLDDSYTEITQENWINITALYSLWELEVSTNISEEVKTRLKEMMEKWKDFVYEKMFELYKKLINKEELTKKEKIFVDVLETNWICSINSKDFIKNLLKQISNNNTKYDISTLNLQTKTNLSFKKLMIFSDKELFDEYIENNFDDFSEEILYTLNKLNTANDKDFSNSFYFWVFKEFLKSNEVKNKYKEFKNFFILCSEWILEKDENWVKFGLDICKKLKTLDKEIVLEYLKAKNNWAEQEFLDYIKNLRQSILSWKPIESNPKYENVTTIILKTIYPQWNYDVFKVLDQMNDKTEDLSKFKYEKDWYEINIWWISYKLKDWEETNDSLMNAYDNRITKLKHFKKWKKDDLEKYLKELNFWFKAKTIEWKILEYIFREWSQKQDLDLIIIYDIVFGDYELINDNYPFTENYENFIENENLRNYTKLQLLCEKYGDSIKDVLSIIKLKVENNEDKDLFLNEDAGDLRNITDLSNEIFEYVNNEILSLEEKIYLWESKITDDKKWDVFKNILKSWIISKFDKKDRNISSRAIKISKQFEISELQNKTNFINKLTNLILWNEKQISSRKINSYKDSILWELKNEILKYEIVKEEWESKHIKTKWYFWEWNHTALAWMVAHICISPDVNKWNNPNWLDFVLYDIEQEKSLWTCVLYLIEEEWKKYLFYWPNPSTSFVSNVDPDVLYKKITNIILGFAEKNNIDKIITDTTYWRWSNRESISKIMWKKTLWKIDLEKGFKFWNTWYSYKDWLSILWEKQI